MIVIDCELKLYGYNSYGAALGGSNENLWMKILFDVFSLELAQKSGALLTNDRNEDDLHLFAHWYDDGIENFDWWIMEMQLGYELGCIAEKLKYDPENMENLRAALWCHHNGISIDHRWENLHSFKKALNKA